MSRPRKPDHEITPELAKLVVEGAPNYDHDMLINHVLGALRNAYERGKIAGGVEARETMLRSQLAFYEGNAQRAAGSANEVRNELNEVLDALGKTRVVPP